MPASFVCVEGNQKKVTDRMFHVEQKHKQAMTRYNNQQELF